METMINIDVPDLDKAVNFYQRAAGLRLYRHLFENTVAELAGASVRIFLLLKDSGTNPVPGKSISRDYRRHWTPVHLDIVVSNIDPATEEAVAAGAVREGKIQSHRWGRQACMSDPFGNGFCFLQWQDRGYDATKPA